MAKQMLLGFKKKTKHNPAAGNSDCRVQGKSVADSHTSKLSSLGVRMAGKRKEQNTALLSCNHRHTQTLETVRNDTRVHPSDGQVY